jgi:hypothetical protein
MPHGTTSCVRVGDLYDHENRGFAATTGAIANGSQHGTTLSLVLLSAHE